MSQIPTRDTSGRCEGECRDLVREGNEKRQNKIKHEAYTTGPTKRVASAKSRNEPPGFLGGHV